MLGKQKSDLLGWAVLVGMMLLLLEITFFNSGLIFSLLVATGMIFLGRKRQHKSYGKVLFWLGILFLTLSILNMAAVKFFLVLFLGLIVYQFAKSKRHPPIITPIVREGTSNERLLTKTPLLKNIFIGEQRTPEHVYEWNDINIQTGIGDTIIDLSYTVLPKGETVIFIRGLVGRVTVHVPYDVEVSVNHSALLGVADILQQEETRVWNQRLQLQSDDYDSADQKVKIFTSILVGDLEVKRV